jgi:hypothetical protein
MNRRKLIELWVAASAASIFGKSLASEAREISMAKAMTERDWNEFLEDATRLFDEVGDKASLDDEVFVHGLSALAVGLTNIPPSEAFTNPGLGPDMRFGPVSLNARRPFFVVQWQLDAGAVLPPHDHPNYSFCTLGLEGEVRIQNFEIEGSPPPYDSQDSFELRKTQDQLIGPQRINTLTRTRDNIHRLEAGSTGARGIDIGILHAQDVGFSYLQLEAEGIDNHHRARWDPDLTRRVRNG